MKLLVPSIPKLRSVYCLLLLKAMDGNGLVTWEDVNNAVSIVGTVPTKSQVKKYLVMLSNHDPPLIKYRGSTVFTHFYSVQIYGVDEDGTIFRQTLNFARMFKNDIILAISSDDTENLTTIQDVIKVHNHEKA